MNPLDLTEWMDVVVLALDGAWRTGYSPQEVTRTLEAKQVMNFKRIYPLPLSQDYPSEHIDG